MKILKIIVIGALFLVLLSSKVNAQLGIKGGLNITNYILDDSKIKDNDFKYGYNAGIFLRIPVLGIISLQPELLYSQKGAKIEFTNTLIKTQKYTTTNNYIEVPVLIDLEISRILHVHAGPYFSYLINSKISNPDNNVIINNNFSFDKEKLEDIDMGLAFGASLVLNRFDLGIRYNMGAKPIGKEININGLLERFPDVKNSAIYVSLGIMLW